MLKKNKRKRGAIVARCLAAIDVDRAERNYRHHEAAFESRPGDAVGLMKAVKALANADRLWLEARRRGMLVEAVWRN